MSNWIPVKVEELKAFDVILHISSVWVVQSVIPRLYPDSDLIIHATRVDDGKQTRLTFSPFSVGYLVQKLSR